MDKLREKFDNLVKSLSTKEKLFIGIVILLGVIAIFYQFEWSGFGKDSNLSETTKLVINPKDGKPFTFIETTKHSQSAKTLWDWLSLTSFM